MATNENHWTDYVYILAADYEALPDKRREDLRRALNELPDIDWREVKAEASGMPATVRFYARSMDAFAPVAKVLRAHGIQGPIREGHKA
jgi:hypothetical protein